MCIIAASVYVYFRFVMSMHAQLERTRAAHISGKYKQEAWINRITKWDSFK